MKLEKIIFLISLIIACLISAPLILLIHEAGHAFLALILGSTYSIVLSKETLTLTGSMSTITSYIMVTPVMFWTTINLFVNPSFTLPFKSAAVATTTVTSISQAFIPLIAVGGLLFTIIFTIVFSEIGDLVNNPAWSGFFSGMMVSSVMAVWAAVSDLSMLLLTRTALFLLSLIFLLMAYFVLCDIRSKWSRI